MSTFYDSQNQNPKICIYKWTSEIQFRSLPTTWTALVREKLKRLPFTHGKKRRRFTALKAIEIMGAETNTRIFMYACMYKISFVFDLGRNFVAISLKLGRTVVSIENWSCIVSESIRPNEGEARGHANSRIFRKRKPDYWFFSNSIGWQLAMKKMFYKYLTRSVNLGGSGVITTLLKMRFYSIFKKFFHWILVILSKILWDHNEWNCNNSRGWRNTLRNQY